MALREEFVRIGNKLFRWRSYLPLMVFAVLLVALEDYHYLRNSRSLDQIWELLCVLISFLGLSIRIITLGYTPERTSGRNTKNQICESLNTTGAYSVVRHPLYLGNFFISLGLIISVRALWAGIIILLIFWLYYERIMFAEEEFLRDKFGDAYLEWTERTPAFIPRLRNFHKPSLSFSFRKIIRREYSSFFGIISAFAFLEIIKDRIINDSFRFDPIWFSVFVFGFIVYATIRILAKKTKLLNVYRVTQKQ